jgi:hypothetical protein
MVAQAGVRLSAPWLEDGVVWWLEGRAAGGGRVVLVRRDPDGSRVDVVPDDFNVRTSVHEYGGGAYCIHRGVAYCSTSPTSACTIEAGAKPAPITPDVPTGGNAMPTVASLTTEARIGVRERHTEVDCCRRRERARRRSD